MFILQCIEISIKLIKFLYIIADIKKKALKIIFTLSVNLLFTYEDRLINLFNTTCDLIVYTIQLITCNHNT